MVALHTSKNEEDPIKNEDARVLTRLYDVFSEQQNSAEIRTHPSFYSSSYLQE